MTLPAIVLGLFAVGVLIVEVWVAIRLRIARRNRAAALARKKAVTDDAFDWMIADATEIAARLRREETVLGIGVYCWRRRAALIFYLEGLAERLKKERG